MGHLETVTAEITSATLSIVTLLVVVLGTLAGFAAFVAGLAGSVGVSLPYIPAEAGLNILTGSLAAFVVWAFTVLVATFSGIVRANASS